MQKEKFVCKKFFLMKKTPFFWPMSEKWSKWPKTSRNGKVEQKKKNILGWTPPPNKKTKKQKNNKGAYQHQSHTF